MNNPPVSAVFSACRRYRWELWRPYAQSGTRFVQWIGLNPSTADETQDDPTVRRCINFSASWGYDRMCMTNLFGWRATDPKDMLMQDDPIGGVNDRHLLFVSSRASLIVCAWGVTGAHLCRARRVTDALLARGRRLHVLALTKDGHPKHPLYLRADLKPVEWKGYE